MKNKGLRVEFRDGETVVASVWMTPQDDEGRLLKFHSAYSDFTIKPGYTAKHRKGQFMVSEVAGDLVTCSGGVQ